MTLTALNTRLQLPGAPEAPIPAPFPLAIGPVRSRSCTRTTISPEPYSVWDRIVSSIGLLSTVFLTFHIEAIHQFFVFPAMRFFWELYSPVVAPPQKLMIIGTDMFLHQVNEPNEPNGYQSQLNKINSN